jgi:adenylate cyclase
VGDIVNTTSRLEALTKEYTAQLVAPGEVVDAAGAGLSAFKIEEVRVGGREESTTVHIVDDASGLST